MSPSAAFLLSPPLRPFSSTSSYHRTSTRCAVQPPSTQPSPPSPAPSPSPSPPPPSPPPRRSNLQVVAERLYDTVTDIQQHYLRVLTTTLPPAPTTSPRLVILGSGWAAHSLIKVIDSASIPSVTLISPRNFFFFTPLLNASAVGTVEFRSIVEPVRKSNPFIHFFEAFAEDVDLERKVVKCRRGKRDGVGEGELFEVPYDLLVIAVGETTATFGVPGARQFAYFLKEISDARNIRVKLLDTLEKAALPMWTEQERSDMLHFIVVGGGPTGCEFAGELSDFVASDLAPRYGSSLVSLIRVTLLQSGKSILNQFEASLQSVALKNFQGRVDVRLGVRVSEVTDEHVILGNGETMKYGILVWAAGNGTRGIVGRVLQSLGKGSADENIAKRAKIMVDAWLRVEGVDGVFAAGDCAVVQGEPLPSTAQVAGQQGAFLGRLLSKADVKELDTIQGPVNKESGKVMSPFRFLSLGIMAYLGNERAVVQVQATDERNIKIGGRVAYALWRSVYAVKQVDVRNRVLVLFDYLKTRVFGRDISQF